MLLWRSIQREIVNCILRETEAFADTYTPSSSPLFLSSFVMAPPPPPPGPPPPPAPASDLQGGSNEDTAGALFAEISALGEKGVRGGLKKATRGPVNEITSESSVKALLTPKKKVVNLGGEPKCVLTGKKWNIEYQNGATGDKAVSIDTDLKQTVYIFKCHDSLVKINGKVNAVVLDGCSKTACVFDEALASVELVNSKDIQIQCTKTAPAVSIDGCTAVTYYMSPEYALAQIITAKSASVNLIRPTEDDGKSFHSLLLNFDTSPFLSLTN